jgi:methyl-accepting chemotaxis protein
MKPMDARHFEVWLPLPVGLLAGGLAGGVLHWAVPGLPVGVAILVTALAAALATGVAALFLQGLGLGEIARLLTRMADRQDVGDFLRRGFPGRLEAEIKNLQVAWVKDRRQVEQQVAEAKQSAQYLLATSAQVFGLLENYLNKVRKKAKAVDGSSERLSKIIAINESLISSDGEMSNSVHEIAADVKVASQTASDGIKSVGYEIRAMSDLRTTVGSSTTIITELNDLAKHIQEFVTRIGGISRQTHLLSLNAGIEAARAGESGRGFAVVASEIRALSENSKQATLEVTNLIHEIHRRTDEVIDILRNTSKLEENIKIVYSAGDTFMHIGREVKEIDARVNRIDQLIAETATDSQLVAKLLLELKKVMDEGQGLQTDLDRELDELMHLWRQRLESRSTPSAGGRMNA